LRQLTSPAPNFLPYKSGKQRQLLPLKSAEPACHGSYCRGGTAPNNHLTNSGKTLICLYISRLSFFFPVSTQQAPEDLRDRQCNMGAKTIVSGHKASKRRKTNDKRPPPKERPFQ